MKRKTEKRLAKKRRSTNPAQQLPHLPIDVSPFLESSPVGEMLVCDQSILIDCPARPPKVLIPVNDQESALYALESAMARRWPAGTQFMLVTVVEVLTDRSPQEAIGHREILLAEQNEYRKAMLSWLTRLKHLFSVTFPDTWTDLESGRISEKICEIASNWGADYILIGSHELNAVSRMAIGSIASNVLTKAPCAVEAVRFKKLRDLFCSSEGVTAEKIRQLASQAPHRVIVACDLSEESVPIIDWVAESSWLANTEIKLINVTKATKRDPGVSFFSGRQTYLSEQIYQSMLETRLRLLARRIADKQPDCKLELLVLQSDSVSDAILELASSWDADLVVIGTQSESQIDDCEFGSNAIIMMDRLECSVIAIRRSNREQVHFSWYSGLQLAPCP
jgi:nucleotide-binding universal stress UspA family protein